MEPEGDRTLAPAPPAERFVPVTACCPSCQRPVRLRADVVRLAGGGDVVDAAGLRAALHLHLRRCPG